MKKQLSRKEQTTANIIVSLIYQLTAAVIGLVLPRYILKSFGSDTNGVLQAISQVLSYTVILECGIGGMVAAAFYKPISEKNHEAISDIFNCTKVFFTKISVVYIVFVGVLSFLAKLIIKTKFDALYVGSLVLILGISNYFNYYFAITQQLLMKADQKLRIIQMTQIITLVLNAALCIAAIKLGASVHAVKIISALVFLFNPVVYRIYVKRHFKISKAIYSDENKLPRKRDGIVHHVSYFIHRNTDIVILGAFCGSKEVSVYAVYNAVVLAAENFLSAISNGIAGAIGDIIARKQSKTLHQTFEIYELVNTVLTSTFSVAAAILIVPFVKIYTDGVNDANYIRPLFAYMLILAQWFYCIRIPYGNVVNAAGHYKQTKFGAYMEVLLNLGISLVFVHKFGLLGVAAGTMIAMAARTVYTAWYLSKDILKRPMLKYFYSMVLNLSVSVILIYLLNKIMTIPCDNFVNWIFSAAIITIVVFIVFILSNVIANIKLITNVFKQVNSEEVN